MGYNKWRGDVEKREGECLKGRGGGGPQGIKNM